LAGTLGHFLAAAMVQLPAIWVLAGFGTAALVVWVFVWEIGRDPRPRQGDPRHLTVRACAQAPGPGVHGHAAGAAHRRGGAGVVGGVGRVSQVARVGSPSIVEDGTIPAGYTNASVGFQLGSNRVSTVLTAAAAILCATMVPRLGRMQRAWMTSPISYHPL
jgi:hypothetical protein